ncbi:MAG: RnfABCDGE type electron transport complex subunit B [Gammaproteobacteria bacterium]
MIKTRSKTATINKILPQTQCGLCTYKGCLPYAKAIAEEGESIKLCPPGGIDGLRALGEITGINPEPYIDEMRKKQKPPMLAVIREDECIGCTKCIQACPVDAILGSGKLMHTVISDECTGCELCVEPCPVDCIDMIEIPPPTERKSDYWRARYEFRNKRLENEKAKEKTKAQPISQKNVKLAAIAAAVERARKKRSESN